jgi:competence ComEA-like helix-hairpin-helix protein
VSKRFLLPLCVIALYWAGTGIIELKEKLSVWSILRKRFPSLDNQMNIYAIIFFVIIAIVLPKTIYPQRFTKIGIKEAGLWFKAHNINTPNIMSDIPRVAFYADGNNFNFVDYGIRHYWKMVNFMIENNIDYLVVEDNSIKEIMPDFFNELKETDFTFLWEYRERDGDRILIYRINKFFGKVNVNEASLEKISLIPGMDLGLARNIVRYRDLNGNFKGPEDLLKVPGMEIKGFDSPWIKFNAFEKFIAFSGNTDFRIESSHK